MRTDYDRVFSISYRLSKTSSFISIVETISSVPIDTETYDGALLKPNRETYLSCSSKSAIL